MQLPSTQKKDLQRTSYVEAGIRIVTEAYRKDRTVTLLCPQFLSMQ